MRKFIGYDLPYDIPRNPDIKIHHTYPRDFAVAVIVKELSKDLLKRS